MIQRVADNSPAHNMGLEPGMIRARIGLEKILIGGDIVLEVQGIPISTDLENVCQNRYARATAAIWTVSRTVKYGATCSRLCGAPSGGMR